MDVLVEIQEAFGLLGAVVLDEVDGRTLAIDGDGVRQVEIVADGGVVEDCRNVFYVGVLGVDFSGVDREVALAAVGYLPSSVTCALPLMVKSPLAHKAELAVEVDWTEAPLIVKLPPANKPGKTLFVITLEFEMRMLPPLRRRGG